MVKYKCRVLAYRRHPKMRITEVLRGTWQANAPHLTETKGVIFPELAIGEEASQMRLGGLGC